ncbi:MAG: hypothetical protein L6Q99_02450 [Planctomycetes bacterium]|nr:hypothetical protein [Planctomycetota bacterium]
MQFDFSQLEDGESFISIPEGTYLCRVAEVREGLARDGSARWGFRLEVAEGEYAGRTAAWDAITWSDRGIHRVKRVLSALGVDTSGPVEIEAADLVGLRAFATLEPEEREDPVTGRRQVRLRVPYAGYAPERASGDGATTSGVGAAGDLGGERVHERPSECSPEHSPECAPDRSLDHSLGRSFDRTRLRPAADGSANGRARERPPER